MTRIGISLMVALFLSVGVEKAASAQKAAQKAKKARGKPAAKAPAEPPQASGEEMNKLKGEFNWGMSPDEVVAKVQERIRDAYQERIQKTANDPTRNDRVRKEMMAELKRAKAKIVRFDGQKTGYDVSIIDQEFLHRNGESMLVAKEETSTRYFFFADERLYKMFIAFDKDMLQGKSFEEFGALMQARFGKAREVKVEEKSKAGVSVKLDHFVWSSKSGDMLRLVDRSEFYDVYCLVIYDGAFSRRQEELRQARRTGPKRDALVEAVTSGAGNERNPHENIVDQITGKEILKPGERQAADITVPTPTNVRAPGPEEVNRKAPSESGRGSKEKAPAGRPSDTRGLAL
jgi:hypothetical protein